jgi:hemerythrin-like metal-binding protein
MAGEYLKWENEYCTGDSVIDKALQQVVNYINLLHQALKNGNDEDTVNEIIAGLTEYSEIHFKLEEDKMKELGYPNIAAHVQEHQIFSDRLSKLGDDMKKKNVSVNLRLLKFMKVWFSGHILNTDKKFHEFKNGGSIGTVQANGKEKKKGSK